MTEIEAAITRMLDEYAFAAAAKDHAAFMRLYDADVRVFDAWECWSYEGAHVWSAAVKGWFDSLGSETVRVTFDETRTSSGTGLVIVSSFVTYTAMSAEGLPQPLRSMQNRVTWAVRLSDRGPRIIHEHTAAPVRFAEMKPMLTR